MLMKHLECRHSGSGDDGLTSSSAEGASVCPATLSIFHIGATLEVENGPAAHHWGRTHTHTPLRAAGFMRLGVQGRRVLESLVGRQRLIWALKGE